MSDTPQGPAWWKAVDGKWYPPERWTGPPGTSPPPNPSWGTPPIGSSASSLPEPTEDEPVVPALPWYRSWPALITAGVLLFLGGYALASAREDEPVGIDQVAATGDSGATDTTTSAVPTTRPRTTTSAPTTTRAPTTTAAPHVPTPEEFTIGIIETERSCFGTAGCLISYRIDPKYNGPPISPTATYTVVYEVRGGEDVQTKNFDLEGGSASFREESISTPPNPTLSAVPVRVLPG